MKTVQRFYFTIPILFTLLLFACTPAPNATPAAELGPTELKYRVLEEFPDFFFCDPDYYPIARADEADLALQRFPELQANAEEFNAILAHLGLAGAAGFTDEQKLLIYQQHKKLAAIVFETAGDAYTFQIQVAESEGAGELVTGRIDRQGSLSILDRVETIVACPICLAAGTLIDTPSGMVPIESLRPGMLVWTVDAVGRRVVEPVLAVGKTAAPANHQMVHLTLADGREIRLSPGHPTADGRTAGELAVGDRLAGSVVAAAERVRYAGAATYDILPAGETGFYWANGIILGSTLAEHEAGE